MSGKQALIGSAVYLLKSLWILFIGLIWAAFVVASLFIFAFVFGIAFGYFYSGAFLFGGVVGCFVWFIIASLWVTA